MNYGQRFLAFLYLGRARLCLRKSLIAGEPATWRFHYKFQHKCPICITFTHIQDYEETDTHVLSIEAKSVQDNLFLRAEVNLYAVPLVTFCRN